MFGMFRRVLDRAIRFRRKDVALLAAASVALNPETVAPRRARKTHVRYFSEKEWDRRKKARKAARLSRRINSINRRCR